MTTFQDIVHRHADLDFRDLEWLRLLVADWQLVSDLSFADLVLWLRDRSGGWSAIGHARPSTSSTAFYDDVVGATAKPVLAARLARVAAVGGWEQAPSSAADDGRREDLFPVAREGRVIGVVARVADPLASRIPGRLELVYQEVGEVLLRMTGDGSYPFESAPTGPRRGAPRVGDGLVRLDPDGVVTYMSPNGVSAFRRLGLGSLTHRNLAEVVTVALQERDPVDESLPVVITGRAPWRCDLEMRGSVLSLRAVPLTRGTGRSRIRVGALILARDVTEIRRSERELMTKEATIREIHHRVKNNLQTVSALLRMQARRTSTEEAKEALAHAGRRISAIAVVYDALARGFDESVDFDDVVDSSLPAAVDIARAATRPVRLRREGSVGQVAAADATALSLVLTELVSNAAEHAFGGADAPPGPDSPEIVVRVARDGRRLRIDVDDNGRGVPEGVATGMGTRIVETLVTTELHGRFDRTRRPEGGTRASVFLLLR
ncbi:MAG: sensor histidine kinase [Kineosporiaceae bacterium]